MFDCQPPSRCWLGGFQLEPFPKTLSVPSAVESRELMKRGSLSASCDYLISQQPLNKIPCLTAPKSAYTMIDIMARLSESPQILQEVVWTSYITARRTVM